MTTFYDYLPAPGLLILRCNLGRKKVLLAKLETSRKRGCFVLGFVDTIKGTLTEQDMKI